MNSSPLLFLSSTACQRPHTKAMVTTLHVRTLQSLLAPEHAPTDLIPVSQSYRYCWYLNFLNSTRLQHRTP